MVVFPGCKINLGLHILAKRKDGFHNISTCFYPVPWTDVLEVLPSTSWSFEQSGLPIPRVDENLCVRAYQVLQNEYKLPPVQLYLHKIIPMGSGLGGGSADAAWTLRVLDSMFHLELSFEKLASYARDLGSDCNFFMQNETMIGSGRGDVLEPIGIHLKGFYLLILSPPFHRSTADAYAAVTPGIPSGELREILQKPVTTWKENLTNDFEPSAFRQFPELKNVKEKLYALGAVYASMTGSGSSVFGIFDKAIHRETQFPGLPGWSGWL